MNIFELALATENKSRGSMNLNKSIHWCAEYVSHVIRNSDIVIEAKTVVSISCNQMFNSMQANPYWYEPEDIIKKGDIVFFNHNHDYDSEGNLDHVGIVVDVGVNGFYSIEGNTYGNQTPDTETRKVYHAFADMDYNCTYPDYYMRYKNPTPTTESPTLATDKEFAKNIEKLESLVDEMKKILKSIDK